MSKKHSVASKKRWKGIGKPVRSRIMSLTVGARWKRTTAAQRKLIAKRMVEAKRLKKISS